MKKIVILGSSPAGVKMIEEVRANGSEDEIILLALDGHYPYKRDAFAPFIAKDIAPDKVFYQAKDFYEKNNVRVILDKKISRINVKKRAIFTEDKEQIDYDALVVTGAPENKFPEIKGIHKTGIYGYKKLTDIDQILNVVPLIDTAAIQSDSFAGLQAAAALVKRGKEVIFISSQNDFFSMHFQEDVVQWLVSRLESSNLRLLRGNTIGEILGDKDAKAIRIKDGKVISAQVIIFADCNEDLKLFTDTGLQINNGIEVNDQFRTNVDSIFALDQVSANRNSEPITPTAVLLEQGIAVAAAINGQHRSAEIPPVSLSLNVEGLVITVLGQTKPKSDTEIRRTFNKNAGYYKGLYLENDRLVGAVLINAESEKSNLEWLISEKSLVEPVNPELPFDEPTSQRHEVEQIGGQDVSTELVDN